MVLSCNPKKMLKIHCLNFFTFLYFLTFCGALIVPQEKKDVCLTPDCVKIASLLLNSIDETADPCEDFWQFACGKWIKTHVINDDQSVTGVLYDLMHRVNVILKNVLEEETSNETAVVRHAKRFYQSCSNTDLIEREDLTSAYSMIESLGGWPVLGATGGWNETTFSLEQLLISSQKSHPDIIMKTSTCECSYNQKPKYTLCIEKPSLGLKDIGFYLRGSDSKALVAYETYVREMAILFGADPAVAKRHTKEMIKFETELVNAASSVSNNYVEERLNISDLNTKYPEFDWMRYFSGILTRPDLNIPVDETTPVCVKIQNLLIQKVLNILNRTPKHVIQNYVVWRQLMELSDALPKRVREINTDFTKAIEGKRKQPDRWVTCIKEVQDIFVLVVERLFIDKTHKKEEKVLVEDMVEGIREAVIELIEEKTWLDDCTKAKTKDKAFSMEKVIGFDPVLNNETHIELEYADYVFHEQSYFQNVLKMKTLKSRRELERLQNKKKTGDSQHITVASLVNAFNAFTRNTILLPAGFLQPPLLDTRYPAYINYGGYGTIIGHEIIHGFDSKGRKFTKDGEYTQDGGPNQWWSNSSILEFETRTKCLMKQYSNFVVKGTNETISGRRTLPDDISDNGGVKASWLAYKKWLKESNGGKPEPLLPGLNYSTSQLFFLNFAYHWCDKMRPEVARKKYKVGEHSPFPSRIIGPLQNNKDFAEAFRCKEGTYMNPKDKCEVW